MTYTPSDPDRYIATAPGEIPVTFEWKGKEYKGILNYIAGCGKHIWRLTVNGLHWG